MRQYRIQNVEGVRIFAREIRHAIANHDERDLRTPLEEETALTFLLGLHGGDRLGFRSSRDRLEELFDWGEEAVGFDVAYHDEGGVVGRVIGVVMPLQVIESHRIQVA